MHRFTALSFRMKYIYRWGLMRNSRIETLSEHSSDAAILAGVLASIAKSEYGADVRVEHVMSSALLHDLSEIITGDMPTPAKYANSGITAEYKRIESEAEGRLLSMLPKGQREHMEPVVTASNLNEREKRIIKAADILCALIKCSEELRFGNSEFASALKSTTERAEKIDLPEVSYFLKHYLPAHSLDLDALLSDE